MSPTRWMGRGCWLLVLMWGSASAFAQTAPKPAPKPTAKTPATANVKMGELGSLNTETNLLTLKAADGTTTEYPLASQVAYWKHRTVAQPTDFKSKESVVVRLQKSRKEGNLQVMTLADKVSWDWLVERRQKTTQATIREIGEGELEVTILPENLPFAYRFTDKTAWSRGGKETTSSDFKAGEKVYIVPRSLPNGRVMARAVSDSGNMVERLKERTGRSVRGRILRVRTEAQEFDLKTEADDERTLPWNAQTLFRQGTKTLAPTALHPGLRVRVSLKRGEKDVWMASRVTLEIVGGKLPTPPKKAMPPPEKPKPLPAKKPG